MNNRFASAIGLACSFLSMGLLAQYFIFRIGFGGPDLTAALSVQSLAFFLLFFPQWLASGLSVVFKRRELPLLTSLGFGLFAAVLLTAGIGYIAAGTETAASCFVILVGCGLFIFNLASYVRTSERPWGMGLVIFVLVLSLAVAGTVWNPPERSPLFIEKLMSGWVPLDTLHHSAITEMFDIHRVSSVGIDELTRHPYHIGSHIWFAALAHLVGEHPWLFYQLGYPVVIVPFFFFTLLSFTQSVRRFYTDGPMPAAKIAWLEWSVLGAALIGCFPSIVITATHSVTLILNNESFTVGLALGFCLGIWIADMFPDKNNFSMRGRSRAVFLFLIVPAAIALAGFTKVSLLILLPAGLLYVAGRLDSFRSPRVWGWGLFVGVALLPLMIYLSRSQTTEIHIFDFIRNYVNRAYWPVYYPVFYGWPLAYAIARCWEKGINTVDELAGAIRSRDFLDVEFLFVIALLGELPPLLLQIMGGGAWYFNSVANALAVAVFAARSPWFLKKLELSWTDNRARRVLSVSAAALGLLITTNFGFRCANPIVDNLTLRARLQTGLTQQPYYDLISTLLRMGRMNVNDKKITVLFIPRSTQRYWTWPTDHAHQLPFLAPALTGLPLVGGISGQVPWLPMCYGYNILDLKRIMRENATNESSDFCGRIERDGFKRVVTLAERDGKLEVKLTNCSSTSDRAL